MPFVETFYKDGVIDSEQFKIALRELVPAAFNSALGPLTPGSIESRNKKQTPEDDFNVDTFVKVEANDFSDRDKDECSDALRAGLEEVFPGVSFGVCTELVKMGWSSETPDPEFDGDMSIEAAIARTREMLVASSLDRKLLVYKQTGEWQPNIMQWAAELIADELGITLISVVDRLHELSNGKCRVISGQ